MTSMTVALTDDEQVDAFEDAVAAVEQDVDAGHLDAERWNGNVKQGEVARILAEAYTGDLVFADESAAENADEGGVVA